MNQIVTNFLVYSSVNSTRLGLNNMPYSVSISIYFIFALMLQNHQWINFVNKYFLYCIQKEPLTTITGLLQNWKQKAPRECLKCSQQKSLKPSKHYIEERWVQYIVQYIVQCNAPTKCTFTFSVYLWSFWSCSENIKCQIYSKLKVFQAHFQALPVLFTQKHVCYIKILFFSYSNFCAPGAKVPIFCDILAWRVTREWHVPELMRFIQKGQSADPQRCSGISLTIDWSISGQTFP